jgi:BON domain
VGDAVTTTVHYTYLSVIRVNTDGVAFVPRSTELTNQDLADQVRSQLGQLIHALDLPRIHVMAEDQTILLHGEVGSESDRDRILNYVRFIPGVESIESHMSVGLLPSDTRPSEGKSEGKSARSPMYKELEGHLVDAGVIGTSARPAMIGILLSILDLIPDQEREHLMGHFPADVKVLVSPWIGVREPITVRTPLELEIAAAFRGGTSVQDASSFVKAYIETLRKFVPEEDQDVQATLNNQLRAYWAAQDPQAAHQDPQTEERI